MEKLKTSFKFDALVKSQFLGFSVIPTKAGIQQNHYLLYAGSVIPDLIRDRHDVPRIFKKPSSLICPQKGKEKIEILRLAFWYYVTGCLAAELL
jgi:hypothetical protein